MMKKKTWLAILFITLIAFLLRVYRLDFVSLRGDEAFTVIFVQRTWDGLWKGIRTIEPNPPLMYLALRVWIALAGAGELATRYFSAFFGVLCVPLLYRLAREMFGGTVIASAAKQSPIPAERLLRRSAPRNDTIAILAAALIAINPYQIWHSQDVRNYTMWPALSLLALIFFWRWWKAERPETIDDRRQTKHLSFVILNLSLFVFATLASLYTHYYDTFVLVALNVFVFASAGLTHRWKTLARWIAAQIVLVAAYAPWVLFGTNRVTTYGEASAQQSVSLPDQFSRTLASFILSDTVPDAFKSILWLPLALALLAVLIYLVRQDRVRAAFLVLWLAVPTHALYVISIGRPLFLERYLNGIAPAYYLVFAVGLGAMLNHKSQITNYKIRLFPFALALLFFLSTAAYALANYYFDPAYAKAPNWRALAQFITDRQQLGDLVIQNFTEMSPIYYQNGSPPVLTVPKDYLPTAADEKTLQQLNQDYRRIWFIPAAPDFWDPNHFVEKYLTHADDREIDTRVAEFGVQLYLTPREFSLRMIPVNARISNTILLGYRVREATGALQFSAGATFTVVLYWRADQPIAKDFNILVQLVDANGRVVAQQGGAPAEGNYPTSQWRAGDLIVDAHELKVDAAPGAYTLVAGMDGIATTVSLTQMTITP